MLRARPNLTGGLTTVESCSPTQDAVLKQCFRCRDALPLNCFHRDPQKPDGCYSICKLCRCGPDLRVKTWRACAGCGKLFAPRHNKGRFVVHCSRECGKATGDWRAEGNGRWKAQSVGYGGLHQRLRKQSHPSGCSHCGQRKDWMHWALDHERCPSPKYEQVGAYIIPYSTDPDAYIWLCVSCHKKMDLAHLAAVP